MTLKENKAYTILMMMGFPLLSLYYGLKTLDWKNKRLIIVLFSVLYGYLLNFSEGADAGAYVRLVETYKELTFSDFWQRFYHILILQPLEGSPTDVFVHLLATFSGSILQTTDSFFPIVGMIYGYFYGLALYKVLNWEKGKKITLTIGMLILLFVIHRSFESMQTVRSWTGMWVLFNGVFGYHQTHKKKYLLLMLAAPFFHFMYIIIALPAFIAVVGTKIPAKLLVGLYFISFIASFNPGGFLNSVKPDNELAEAKVNSYYRETDTGEAVDPIELRREASEGNWYAKYGKTDSVYYGATAFLFFLIIGGFYKQLMTPLEKGLFITALLMATLANFGDFAYAFYSRTMANATIYVLAVMVLMSSREVFKKRKIKNKYFVPIGLWIGILIFVPKIVYFVANIIIYTSLLIVAFPFLNIIDGEFNISIREFIELFL